ncbi:MAG: ergothioneine biosynthesis protein EgtB [Rudaea sp.]
MESSSSLSPGQPQAAADRTPAENRNGLSAALSEKYRRVRGQTVALCAALSAEDATVQSMPDASPAKWHLAHTTWFFDEFVLRAAHGGSVAPEVWRYLFNSYYQLVGPMHTRSQRGLLSRPGLAQVLDYRERVDAQMERLIDGMQPDNTVAERVILGLNHEQRHQELILTDIQHLLWLNPLQPAYRGRAQTIARTAAPLRFVRGSDGLAQIGHCGCTFAFDNEQPRHDVLLHPHALANRLVSNGEYLEFVREKGYRTPTLWLAAGWDTVQQQAWGRPLYWSADLQTRFTLDGQRPLDPHAPVCHLSFYEADAFARWAGARLPTEFEWEVAAASVAMDGNFLEGGALQPLAAAGDVGDHPLQMYGDVWEWTCSPYVGYPGFKPTSGAIGEYNGKFMSDQWVLRGGSCATPRDHMRATYRNFFPAHARWQFAGVRLARDA